jgi:hypothetical protein
MPAVRANRWPKQHANAPAAGLGFRLASFATRNFFCGGSLHRGLLTAMPARVYARRREVDVAGQMIADELFAAQI